MHHGAAFRTHLGKTHVVYLAQKWVDLQTHGSMFSAAVASPTAIRNIGQKEGQEAHEYLDVVPGKLD